MRAMVSCVVLHGITRLSPPITCIDHAADDESSPRGGPSRGSTGGTCEYLTVLGHREDVISVLGQLWPPKAIGSVGRGGVAEKWP